MISVIVRHLQDSRRAKGSPLSADGLFARSPSEPRTPPDLCHCSSSRMGSLCREPSNSQPHSPMPTASQDLDSQSDAVLASLDSRWLGETRSDELLWRHWRRCRAGICKFAVLHRNIDGHDRLASIFEEYERFFPRMRIRKLLGGSVGEVASVAQSGEERGLDREGRMAPAAWTAREVIWEGRAGVSWWSLRTNRSCRRSN